MSAALAKKLIVTPQKNSFAITRQDIGTITVQRPDAATVAKTKEAAKSIFVEAFTSTYSEYHQKSKSPLTIEAWLRLTGGRTINQWLSDVFEDEYVEYTEGKKSFIHVTRGDDQLVGWLSHSPVSETGDVYLSQCSLEAGTRDKGVASLAFAETLDKHIQELFPGVKEVKLIARKINERAEKLYTKAGFTKDETIDPSVYGDSYDDRYVGYRIRLKS